MRLDDVESRASRRRYEQPEKAVFERSKGWDIMATPVGVLVSRTDAVKAPRDKLEPDTILIPWTMVSAPPAVSADQGDQKRKVG